MGFGLEKEGAGSAENREQRADVLLRFLNTAENIESLHGNKVETVFSDEEHRREFVERLSDEEFFQLLNGLNGILRDKKREDWNMDGEGVALTGIIGGYIPPDFADRPALLSEALSAAKKMSSAGRDMKDIALLISSSINTVHPYRDGNGRTGRIFYLLLSKGYTEDSKVDIQAALSEWGRDRVVIDPGIIQGSLTILVREEAGYSDPRRNPYRIINMYRERDKGPLEFMEGVADEDKEKFLHLSANDGDKLLTCSVLIFLENNPDIDISKYVFPHSDNAFINRSSYSFIKSRPFVRTLHPEQISQILLTHRNLKKRYVEIMIDAFADPENKKYEVEDNEGKMLPLKTYFEIEMGKYQEKFDEEEKSIQAFRKARQQGGAS